MSSNDQTSFLSSLPRNETITEEHIPLLLQGLKSEEDSIRIETLTCLGDLNREEPNRNLLGQKRDFVEALVAELDSSSQIVVQLAARAVGNLSYQQESNRNLLVELQVPFKLLSILQSADDPTLQKNVTGALANVSFVTDTLQEQLVQKGVVPVLMKQLQSDNELVVVMTIRAIANILDDSTHSDFVNSECMENLAMLLFGNESALIRSDALTTLGTITENNDEDLHRFASRDDWLFKVYNIAKNDEDEQVRDDAWGFLAKIAESVQTRPLFNEKGLLEKLMKDVDVNADPVPLSNTLHILGLLAAHDSCMDVIFESFSVFFDLLKHEDENVKTYTAMIVGNISRTDEYCIRLVKAGAIPILKQMCEQGARIQHLALGALRNIAIPNENKAPIIEQEGMLETLNSCLTKSTSAHVLYNGVILLKILVTGGDRFIDEIVKANTVQVIDKLLDRNLEDGQERIHYEAARLLLMIANSNDTNMNVVMEHNGPKSISLLLSTSFDLLQTEAIATLKKIPSKYCEKVATKENINRLSELGKAKEGQASAEIQKILKVLSAFEKIHEVKEETDEKEQ